MKQILFILSLAVLLSGLYTSCKKNSLDTMRENEIVALEKYVKDNNLADAKDASGIYFKLTERSADTTLIRSKFKLMMFFNITLLDGTQLRRDLGFSTQDRDGRSYEEYPFFVDVSNAEINDRYVQQISGLHIGLKKMHVGDKAFMVIPSELAFKAVDKSSIGIPRFSTLLVTVTVRYGYSPKQQQEENQ